MKILTNDPSFTAWGYAVIDIDGKVYETGCIKTAPEQKKRRIRKSDDVIRRMSDIIFEITNVIKTHKIEYILSEAPHGSQNASAAVMIGAVTGLLQAIADCMGIPIEWYSENDAKKHLLGKISATKKETITAINKIYKVPWTGIKYRDEAVADAVAVFHVAQHLSTTFRYFKTKPKRHENI